MTTPQGFQEAAGHFGGDHGLLPSEVMPCFASALLACMAQWKCWQHALGGLPQCKRAQTGLERNPDSHRGRWGSGVPGTATLEATLWARQRLLIGIKT